MDLIVSRSEGLYSPQANLYLNPDRAVSRALVTHPAALARASGSEQIFALAGLPGSAAGLRAAPEHQPFRIGDVEVSLASAGLGPGSCSVRLALGGQRLWVIGAHRALPPPEVVETSVALDASYGLPIYRWPDLHTVGLELQEWLGSVLAEQRTPVLITSAWHASLVLPLIPIDTPLFASPSLLLMIQTLRPGVSPLQALPSKRSGVLGGVVLCTASELPARLSSHRVAATSGRMRIRGIRKRLSVDRGLVLSARPDHPMLLAAVQHLRAARVLTFGTHAEPLARKLRERGLRADSLPTLDR